MLEWGCRCEAVDEAQAARPAWTRSARAILIVGLMAAGMPAAASDTQYNLLGWYQRSTGGVLRSLLFKAGYGQGCPGPVDMQPCYYAGNAWTSANGVVTAVTAAGAPTWTWNGTTLTETGLFWATQFLNNSPNATAVISDKVANLTITPGTQGVTALHYQCIEGYYLASVAASGCKDTSFGNNGVDESTAGWEVGGNPFCVTLAIGGDDWSLLDVSDGVPGTPYPRGLTAQAAGLAGAGCAQTSGAFDLWHVIRDDGVMLILANTANIGSCFLYGSGLTPLCPADAALARASYLVLIRQGESDTDAEGMPDVVDNCTLLVNPDQRDTNGDGYGNICDPDFNNDATVNINDFNRLKARLNIVPVVDVDTDLDGDGAVNINDLNRLKGFLGKPPGPSGLHPNCPPTCP